MTRSALIFDTAPGIRLAAETFGDPDAPAVLMLHGGGQSRHSWNATATSLADAGWRVITVDLRGHGQSTHPRPVGLSYSKTNRCAAEDRARPASHT